MHMAPSFLTEAITREPKHHNGTSDICGRGCELTNHRMSVQFGSIPPFVFHTFPCCRLPDVHLQPIGCHPERLLQRIRPSTHRRRIGCKGPDAHKTMISEAREFSAGLHIYRSGWAWLGLPAMTQNAASRYKFDGITRLPPELVSVPHYARQHLTFTFYLLPRTYRPCSTTPVIWARKLEAKCPTKLSTTIL